MILKINADTFGIISGSLCLVHCVATPFLFIARACTDTCCSSTPVWWQLVDYLFIVISFAAIYYASKNTNKKWMQIALWSSWAVLLFTILNETFETGLLPEMFIYFPASAIVGLHFYNRRYCKCAKDKCCAS